MHRLRKLEELRAMTVTAADGPIGAIEDMYYDDVTWTVRYLLAGPLPGGRRALLSPIGVRKVDDPRRMIEVSGTLAQIARCPVARLEQFSRAFETSYHRYFGWPVYWCGEERWGAGPFPLDITTPGRTAVPPERERSALRSLRSLLEYRVQARDGEVGTVNDVIINDETWEVRYCAVGTGAWLQSRPVLLSPHWFDHLAAEKKIIFTDLQREAMRNAPAYDPASVITRDYEWRLFKHYHRERDWEAVVVGRSLAGKS